MMPQNYYTEYKGIYYQFIPLPSNYGVDVWKLSSTEDNMNHVAWFDANKFRLDECIENFLEQLKQPYAPTEQRA